MFLTEYEIIVITIDMFYAFDVLCIIVEYSILA